MLSEKIALISHTLEVDPCGRIVMKSSAVDAQKDTESDPSAQLQLTVQLTVHNRNSPIQSQDIQTLQESQSNQVSTNVPSNCKSVIGATILILIDLY